MGQDDGILGDEVAVEHHVLTHGVLHAKRNDVGLAQDFHGGGLQVGQAGLELEGGKSARAHFIRDLLVAFLLHLQEHSGSK